MAINKAMRAALKAISYPDPDISKAYKLVRKVENITAVKTIKPRLCSITDDAVIDGSRLIPVRIYSSERDAPDGLILFFHGGGWVCGNLDSYNSVCLNMVRELKKSVISVDYRLAPEFRFPSGLNDCYAVARALFVDKYLPQFKNEDIIIMGDSAGGNLAAAVSLMARDKGEFIPSRQILIYPSTFNDHSPDSPFESIRENGFEYLLTSKRIEGYIQLYMSCDDDKSSPYLAPLLAESLSNQPETLILTAEYCPLRDEGEEYGNRLRNAGNSVTIYRMPDALHGFFTLPNRFEHVKKTFVILKDFLGGGIDVK